MTLLVPGSSAVNRSGSSSRIYRMYLSLWHLAFAVRNPWFPSLALPSPMSWSFHCTETDFGAICQLPYLINEMVETMREPWSFSSTCFELEFFHLLKNSWHRKDGLLALTPSYFSTPSLPCVGTQTPTPLVCGLPTLGFSLKLCWLGWKVCWGPSIISGPA